MTPSALVEPLNELATALTRMDHDSIESCRSRLEELAVELKGEQLARAEGVLSKVQFCRALTQNAARFYAGLSRVVALQGSAYTPTGDEPAPDAATSLAVRG
jgi:hypothetical protein